MTKRLNKPDAEQERLQLGISLFQRKELSISAAAKVAGKPLAEMLTLVSTMGIPVVDYTQEEADTEKAFIQVWVKNHQF